MKQVNMNGVNIKLPEGVNMVQTEDGTWAIVINGKRVDDPIAKKVDDSGRIYNGHLVKRWVMAQMFRILNSGRKYNDYVNLHYSYDYQFLERIPEELDTIIAMERDGDKEALDKETAFWNIRTIYRCYAQYYYDVQVYIDNLKAKKCKGVPYKTIKRYGDVFVEDINTKVLYPMYETVMCMSECGSYKSLKKYVDKFNRELYIRLGWGSGFKKCDAWMDAFKGYGAYFTLENMILSHGCSLGCYDEVKGRQFGWGNNVTYLKGEKAYEYMQSKLDHYAGYQWLGMLKQCIEDNHFTFGR